MAAADHFERVEILGVPVGAINMPDAVGQILDWAVRHESRYVCACDVHSLMRAHNDRQHREALRHADLVTPDGQPLVWTARMRGNTHIARVCGPDLLAEVCHASRHLGLRHYFYGGAEGVAAKVAGELQKIYPGLEVAGTECPPFRPLTPDDEEALRQRVAAARANLMWIGLGCPKQEQWMLDHIGQIPGVVLIGVGAAFDFHSKRVQRAPLWMQRWGLEWLHRLASEPRRLWRRYVILAPQFVVASLTETVRQRLSAVRAARSARGT